MRTFVILALLGAASAYFTQLPEDDGVWGIVTQGVYTCTCPTLPSMRRNAVAEP